MKYRYWLCICALAFGMITFGCSDDDTNVTEIIQQAGDVVGELDEPTGDDGAYVISMKGGQGTGASGGEGGDVYLDCYSNVGMYVKTRDLDTSFTVPAPVYPEDLGDNGVTISEDTEVAVVTEEPVAGELYLVANDYYLYLSDGDTTLAESEERVSGLKVDARAILTLGLNYDWNGSGYLDCAYLCFADDVVINGTLATASLLATGELRHDVAALAGDKGSLRLDISGRLTTAAGSVIDTSGDDAAAESDARGGDGGRIDIDVENGMYFVGRIDASGGAGDGSGIGGWGAVYNNNNTTNSISIDCDDCTLINTGEVVSSGGNGSTGGNAGYIYFDAGALFYNTGDLYAIGGTGATADGGNGNYINFNAYLSLFNSGDMYTNGGNGATAGGNAGGIDWYGGESDAGDLLNSGDLYVNGGDCIGEAGDGGDAVSAEGTAVILKTEGGDLVSSGEIQAMGGTGAGEESYGGNGGDLEFSMDYGEDAGYGDEVAAGLIQVTGSIYLDGGSGFYGGSGGDLDVTNDEYDGSVFPPVQPSELLGYAQLDTSGGEGATDGGDAGDVEMYTEDAWYGDDYTAYPVGAIANRVAILAKGGNGGTGDGGDGGYLDWEAEGEAYFGTTVVLNSGDIDVSGGSGNNGGDGGGIYLYGHDYVENTGTITALGGDADGDAGDGETISAGGGYGVEGEGIELYSAADVLNSGDVIATGGEATGTATGTGTINGGDSGVFSMWAVGTATLSGSLYFNGGDSTDVAGDGDDVEIGSMKTASAITSELITVAAGSGDTAGEVGEIFIDGFDVTPLDGTLQ